MLLGGIIKHLPRSHFRIVLCPITTPGKRTSPSLVEAADEVVQLPLKVAKARELLEELRCGPRDDNDDGGFLGLSMQSLHTSLVPREVFVYRIVVPHTGSGII